MPILCIRFPKPGGSHVYFIGADADAMRKDAEVFGADPSQGEAMDLERVEREWPAGRDKGNFQNGRTAALRGTPSYWLY